MGCFFEKGVGTLAEPTLSSVCGLGCFFEKGVDFLTPLEADMLVKVGKRTGFQAEDELPKNVRDVQKIDCEDPKCRFDVFVGEVYRRASELLGLPPQNFESLEFLAYGPGQHYTVHPDAMQNFLYEPRIGPSGHRVLTIFMCLSDVEKGGETDFPNAGISVRPQKGKVVVWANVEQDITKISRFANHAAKPVVAG